MPFRFAKFKCIMIGALLVLAGMPAQTALAACSPGASPGFSSGAKISGNQVLICASSSQQQAVSSTSNSITKTTPKAAPKAAVTPKPAAPVSATIKCPSSVTTTAQIVSATLLGCKVPGPSAKPPSTPKPTLSAKSKSIESISTSAQSDQAMFSPEPFSIQPSSSTAQTAEAVIFTSDARDHERSAMILGRLGYVRFVPVSFSWRHSPGQNSPVVVLSFATSGTKPVSLQVTFQASSRFSLAEPWVVVGDVVATAQASVEVAEPATRIPAQPVAKTKVKPRLVFAACETLPSTYRC